jgi:isoleucyl-tRNA synthetase
MPFLAEYLWRRLVSAEESVFLAGWPPQPEVDDALLDEVAAVRRIVELGRRARDEARLKLRQPLRRLVVEGVRVGAPHDREIADELNVKEVEFAAVESELRVKPNLPVLGPKLGKELGVVRAALASGDFESLPGGRFRVAGRELGPDEVIVERTGREGWAVAAADGVTVAVETALDDELLLEGRVFDLVHQVNSMRREQGFELTDRIVLTLPPELEPLLRWEQRIRDDVLAVEIRVDGGADLSIARADARE